MQTPRETIWIGKGNKGLRALIGYIAFAPFVTNVATYIETGPIEDWRWRGLIDWSLHWYVGGESRRGTKSCGRDAREKDFFHMTFPMNSAKPVLYLGGYRDSCPEQYAEKSLLRRIPWDVIQ